MALKYAALKQRARSLRKQGLSYSVISRQLGIAKSTLHYWVYDLPPSSYQNNKDLQLKHLSRIRVLASRAHQTARISRIEAIRSRVVKQVAGYPLKNIGVQRMLAAMLYWAEGSKTGRGQFAFANTDPALAHLFITLLRNGFSIDEKRIRIKLYLHHYHLIGKTRRFWSKQLRVPEQQFEKVYIKPRKNTHRKRKNFAGICFIRYSVGSERLKQEMLILAREIQKRIVLGRP